MQNHDPNIFLSIVVPLYNEVENVERLWQKLEPVVERLKKPYEVILVDDGSTDGTREKVRLLAHKHPSIHAILFRGNFGQSAAMAAGFAATRGEIVVAMDGDLQNDPADIPALLAKIEQGYDVVSGWRKHRKDKLVLRKIPSKIANRLICSVTNVRLHDTGCSLKAFRGDVLRRISLYGELHRFIPALLRIEGAKITEMPVRHHPRQFGTSKYNLSRTFRVIMDLINIRLIMRHLHNPLIFFAKIGALFFICGLMSLIAMFYKLFVQHATLIDINILLILTVLLWVSAGQMIFFGLIGKLIVQTGSRKSFFEILDGPAARTEDIQN